MITQQNKDLKHGTPELTESTTFHFFIVERFIVLAASVHVI